MNLLRKFQVEVLLGKLSFKKKADIYNENHGYEDAASGNETKCVSELHSTSWIGFLHFC